METEVRITVNKTLIKIPHLFSSKNTPFIMEKKVRNAVNSETQDINKKPHLFSSRNTQFRGLLWKTRSGLQLTPTILGSKKKIIWSIYWSFDSRQYWRGCCSIDAPETFRTFAYNNSSKRCSSIVCKKCVLQHLLQYHLLYF